MIDVRRARQAFDRLDAWVTERDYSGWDPHDALNSPFLSRLAGDRRLVGQVLVQAVKRSPINPRRGLGVLSGRNPKAIGLFLASYCRRYEVAPNPVDRARMTALADWLDRHRAVQGTGAGWGYNFAWPNRDFFAPAGTATVVNTSFNGLAFVMMHDALAADDPASAARALAIANEACEFVRSGLNRPHESADELCLSYTPIDQRVVYNASLLGGWLLAEVGKRTDDPALGRDAQRIARFVARRQRKDGSWPYGESARNQFEDNFHTAYVLVALRRIGRATETDEFDRAIERGFAGWRDTFFLEDGAPRYFRHATFPIDAHSAAQAILTFLAFDDMPGGIAGAARVTNWTLDHLQDPAGFFYYQRTRWYTNRIPYMRWVQAWMHRSLSELLWWDARHAS